MDMQRGQHQRRVVLQFRCEPLLDYVVAALRVQVIQRVQVLLGEGGGRRRHERHSEQTPQFMGART